MCKRVVFIASFVFLGNFCNCAQQPKVGAQGRENSLYNTYIITPYKKYIKHYIPQKESIMTVLIASAGIGVGCLLHKVFGRGQANDTGITISTTG
ncbi:MAG: hypothetical protein LBS83_03555 [Holosporales bacterium]|jgi:hypothetical protein|nr:hypothetical protein [Holosporales bacterium]